MIAIVQQQNKFRINGFVSNESTIKRNGFNVKSSCANTIKMNTVTNKAVMPRNVKKVNNDLLNKC